MSRVWSVMCGSPEMLGQAYGSYELQDLLQSTASPCWSPQEADIWGTLTQQQRWILSVLSGTVLSHEESGTPISISFFPSGWAWGEDTPEPDKTEIMLTLMEFLCFFNIFLTHFLKMYFVRRISLPHPLWSCSPQVVPICNNPICSHKASEFSHMKDHSIPRDEESYFFGLPLSLHNPLELPKLFASSRLASLRFLSKASSTEGPASQAHQIHTSLSTQFDLEYASSAHKQLRGWITFLSERNVLCLWFLKSVHLSYFGGVQLSSTSPCFHCYFSFLSPKL